MVSIVELHLYCFLALKNINILIFSSPGYRRTAQSHPHLRSLRCYWALNNTGIHTRLSHAAMAPDKQQVILALVLGLAATVIALLSLLVGILQLISTRQAQARVPTVIVRHLRT